MCKTFHWWQKGSSYLLLIIQRNIPLVSYFQNHICITWIHSLFPKWIKIMTSPNKFSMVSTVHVNLSTFLWFWPLWPSGNPLKRANGWQSPVPFHTNCCLVFLRLSSPRTLSTIQACSAYNSSTPQEMNGWEYQMQSYTEWKPQDTRCVWPKVLH